MTIEHEIQVCPSAVHYGMGIPVLEYNDDSGGLVLMPVPTGLPVCRWP